MKRVEKVHGLLRRLCPGGTIDSGEICLCRGLGMEQEMTMSNPSAGGVPIPPGLTRCPVCGEYRGSNVTCLCEGILCRRCEKNRIHRPISNSYDPETNTIRHHPWFSYLKPCNACRSGEKEQGSQS